MQQESSNDEDQAQLLYHSRSGAVACGSADRLPGSRMAAPIAPVESRFIRWVINARAVRRQLFDSHLFADPAWDMLLELYALESEGRRISVSKLSVAAGVPCTTTLRWIEKLESDSLVVRAADPLDGRRIWVGLSQLGRETMHAFADKVLAVGLPI